MKRMILAGFILVSVVAALTICALHQEVESEPTRESTDFFRLTKNTTQYVVRTIPLNNLATQENGTPKVMSSSMKYDRYYMFQEYTHPDDEGKIDTRNMYKLLHESLRYFSVQKDKDYTFSATELANPCDFGTVDETYHHGVNETAQLENANSYDEIPACRTDGTTTYALLGYTLRGQAADAIEFILLPRLSPLVARCRPVSATFPTTE